MPASKDELLALAIACESEEPSEDLDRRIAHATRWIFECPQSWRVWREPPPKFTKSVDEAMSIAADWFMLRFSDIAADGLPICTLGKVHSNRTEEATGIGGRNRALTYAAAALRAAAADLE